MNTMYIGLTAYGLDPGRVFVRVPSERGRWVLTDRCVIEVSCDTCGAIVGEPCRSRYPNDQVPWRPTKHGAGTHIWRRSEWQHIKRSRPRDPPKPHLRAEDYAAGGMEPEEADPIDFEVTRKVTA